MNDLVSPPSAAFGGSVIHFHHLDRCAVIWGFHHPDSCVVVMSLGFH